MNIFNSITTFIRELSNYITFDYIVYGTAGLLVLTLLIAFLTTNFTYEVKLLRNVNKLNKYFVKNPYVNDENIVELNDKMKSVPKTLRYCWQEYMLNRDKAPSEYMNTTSCIDQPCKSSGYVNAATTCGIFSVVIAVLSFLLCMSKYATNEDVRFNTFFFEVLLLPILVVILGFMFVAFLRARHTSIISDLYFSFHEFERNMNKACTTMPPFIDYEVLFTKKEIKEGIPVLQDYLEKRAIQEKKEREEAELNATQYEYYDFDELGVENTLLLERAMKESEKYLNVKRDLSSQVQSKETEMHNYKKNFDEVTKEFERKAQASRESMAQLTEQINQTTIKIEANYMKKKLNEEQTRLQQLEKDYEIATSRYQKQEQEMQTDVQALTDEINRKKAIAEDAMKSECKNYANKVYGHVSQTVQEQSKPYIDQLNEEKMNLETTISDLKATLSSKTDELNRTNTDLTSVTEQLNVQLAEIKALKTLKAYLTSPEFKKSFLSRKELKKLKDGREVQISEDVVKQIADLEDRAKLVEENNKLHKDKIEMLENALESTKQELERTKKLNVELFEKAKAAKAHEQKVDQVTALPENFDFKMMQKPVEQQPQPQPEAVDPEQHVEQPEPQPEVVTPEQHVEQPNVQEHEGEGKIETLDEVLKRAEKEKAQQPKEEVEEEKPAPAKRPMKRMLNLGDKLKKIENAEAKENEELEEKPNRMKKKGSLDSLLSAVNKIQADASSRPKKLKRKTDDEE